MPDIMAPGENIRSAVPGGGYQGGWSGTSMSGPHTTALVGLMWSANPGLKGMVDQTYDIIHETAVRLVGQGGSNCGGDYVDGPNNDWGFGTMDALAAVELAMAFGSPGILQGTVTSSGGQPISGATITAVHEDGFIFMTTTDTAGFYSRMVMSGTYTITASKYGWLPSTAEDVVVIEDEVTTVNFILDPAPSYTVSGVVTDANTGWPLYSSIAIGGAPIEPIWTDIASGEYSISLVAGVNYTFSVNTWVDGYLPQSRQIYLDSDKIENFLLAVNHETCTAPGYSLDYLYLEDFEESGGGFVPCGYPSDLWQWGAPVSWPSNCASGGKCWGTNLNGSYPDNANAHVISPVISLAGEEPPMTARWWQAYYVESSWWDQAIAEVRINGGPWQIMWQHDGGTVQVPWHERTYDISAAAGGTVQFQFRLFTDSSVVYDGYYFDRIAISGAGGCTPADGSLVVGNVYDANTSLGLNNALVSVAGGDVVATYATPGDPEVDDGFYTLFAPLGPQELTASMNGYEDMVVNLEIPLWQTVHQNFILGAGILVPEPDFLEVTVELGSSTTETLTLHNSGSSDTSFEIVEINSGFIPQITSIIGNEKIMPPPGVNTSSAPAGYTPQNPFAFELSASDGVVAIFKDVHAWGSTAVEAFLIANGIPFEVHGSSAFATVDFSAYSMIVISGDQTDGFYNAYGSHIDKFEEYVLAGGFLNFFACDSGWNGGTLNHPLPGGMIWNGWNYDSYNVITDDEHPVVQGVPNPFYGSSASHGYFHTLPDESHVIAQKQSDGQPTIVEYPLGAGWVIAFGQPLEISHDWGWDAGVIMENTLIWGYAYEPAGDVPWLSVNPETGVIPSGGSQEVVVIFDASVVYQPGGYMAKLRVNNDTPYGALTIPVTMHASPPADYGKLEGTVIGLGACDNNPAPLKNALVLIEGATVSVEVLTDANGYYQLWLPEGENPLTITVSKDEHVSGLATDVMIYAGQTTTVNFDLRWLRSCFSVDPTSLEATLELGAVDYHTLTLHNSGAAAGEFELRKVGLGFTPIRQVSIPAFTGEIPPIAEAISLERAPIVSYSGVDASEVSGLLSGAPAYGVDVYPGQNLVYWENIDFPGSWNIIASIWDAFFAGDFINGDFETLYVLDFYTNELKTVNTTTGAITYVGPSMPYGGENWTGMTGSISGVMYAASTNINRSTLYTIDLDTGAAAVIGQVTGGANCVIDIAITPEDVIYAVDICTDMLFSIDPATGAGTQIGSIGFNANYAQGMDYEEGSGTLYLAAFNGNTGQGELRIADINTGNTVLVGPFPGGAEVGAFGFATGGGFEVPWLILDPEIGTVLPGAYLDVDVIFDAGLVTQPGHYEAGITVRTDSPIGNLGVAVDMLVTAPDHYGKLEGIVTGLGACDVNPAPLSRADVTVTSGDYSWTIKTDNMGFYSLWLDEGLSPFTVHVEKDQHEIGHAEGLVIVGTEITTQDFELRWLMPCMSTDPDSLYINLDMGQTATLPLELINTGAGGTTFNITLKNMGYGIPPGGTLVEVPASLDGNAADPGAATFGKAPEGRPMGGSYLDKNPLNTRSTSILLAFADDGGEPLRSILLSYDDIEVVDTADLRYSIPPLSTFEAYDVVIVWNNYYYADSTLLGNILADYVDGGGRVILATFNWQWLGFGLGGRFMSEYYSPFLNIDSGNHYWWANLGTYNADHPIMAEVTYAQDYYRDYVSLDPDAELVASWDDGEEFVAVKGPVVAINSYLGPYYVWSGDVGKIVHNSINFLMGGSTFNWLSVDPVSGYLPEEDTFSLDVMFDAGAEGVDQPGEYYARLNVKTADALQPTIEVPVTMAIIAPDDWGKLTGFVTSLGHCDQNPAPINKADVLIANNTGETWMLKTGAEGGYALWLPADGSPYSVTVTFTDHELGEATGLIVTGQSTTLQDFDLRWLKPCVLVEPDSLDVSVIQGYSTTLQVTVNNDGGGEAVFRVLEKDLGYLPPSGKIEGTGEWLYRSTTGILMDNNFGQEELAYPKAYRWTSNQPSNFNILIYADDYFHPAPNTFLDQALQTLGLSYTAHYDSDFSGFVNSLNSGDWDIVLFGNDYWAPDSYLLDALNIFVNNDGLLILNTWTVSWYLGNPLWTTLGINWIDDNYDPPNPVYWWDPDHSIFNTPESVPELTSLQGWRYGTYGQRVQPLTDFEAIAGYTTPGPDPNQAALVLGNENRTVFKGFLDGQNDADLDGDGILDGVELWINLIDGIQYGYAMDVPWLSATPDQGNIAPDSSLNLAVTLDAGEVDELGQYFAKLELITNNPINPRIDIPVTMTVVEPAPPVAGFTYAPELIFTGDVVSFTNATTGPGNITYLWEFGDGHTSTEEHPQHAFAAAGLFPVTLTATNEVGSDEFVMNVLVNDPIPESDLSVVITISPMPIYVGVPTTFTAVVGNAGPDDAEGVYIEGEIPASIEFISGANCALDEGILSCDLGTIAAGTSKTAVVVLKFLQVGAFEFDLRVYLDGNDPDPTNNSGTVQVDVLDEPVQNIFLPFIRRQ